MSRAVSTDLNDILDLIHCAEDYGFGRSVFYYSMANITGYVSDQEIESFADTLVTPEMREKGYDDEDREAAIENITEWRNEYANEKKD